MFRAVFGFKFAEIIVIEKQKTTRGLAASERRFFISNISANSNPKTERLET